MAIKTTIVESTGIYQRTVTTGEPGNIEDMKAIHRFTGFEEVLKESESYAKEVLKPYPTEIKTETGYSAGWPCILPEDAPPIARDAYNMMSKIRLFRNAQERGNHDLAYAYAFRIGVISEMMGVRPFEVDLNQYYNNMEKLRSGNREKHGDTDGRRNEAKKQFADIMTRCPKTKKTTAYKTIAKSLGCTGRTVQKYLKIT